MKSEAERLSKRSGLPIEKIEKIMEEELAELPIDVKRRVVMELAKEPKQEVKKVKEEVVGELKQETEAKASLREQLLNLLPSEDDIALVETLDDFEIVYYKGKADVVLVPDVSRRGEFVRLATIYKDAPYGIAEVLAWMGHRMTPEKVIPELVPNRFLKRPPANMSLFHEKRFAIMRTITTVHCAACNEPMRCLVCASYVVCQCGHPIDFYKAEVGSNHYTQIETK